MSVPCVVCGAAGTTPLWDILKRCVACGHIVADLDVERVDPKQLYGLGYFQGEEYYDYLSDEAVYRRNFRSRLRDLKKFSPGEGRLVEVGAAYGLFLDEARAVFQGIGFEICPEAARYAREKLHVDVRTGEFDTASLAGGSMDAFALWDVLEHTPRPDLIMDEVARMLKPGGVVAITTGDIASVSARLQGRRWRLIHPPTHIHYFSRQGLVRLLADRGLRTAHVSYPGYWRSLRQIAFNLFMLGPHPRPRVFEWFRARALCSRGLYSNFFDIMQVIAVKGDRDLDQRTINIDHQERGNA